jgi:hypothetical protein
MVLGGAVPVGRKAEELAGVLDLDMEPRRGFSVFENSGPEVPVGRNAVELAGGAVPVGRNAVELAGVVGAVPEGADTSRADVTFPDWMGTALGPVARSVTFAETTGAPEEPVGMWADWTGTNEDPVAPDNCVLFRLTPVPRGMEMVVNGAVPGSDALTVGIGAVPDNVTLPVASGRTLGLCTVRDLGRPNRSSPEFENSGPVLPLAVGKTTLDSGERVTEGCPAVTKGCSALLLLEEVRFAGIGGSSAEGCSSAPLAVGKIALEFAVSNGTELDGCSTLPLAVGRSKVRRLFDASARSGKHHARVRGDQSHADGRLRDNDHLRRGPHLVPAIRNVQWWW